MDVSADLHELSRCPVGLVSAGVKSVLDIGRCVYSILDARCTIWSNMPIRTMEYLVRSLFR